MAPRTRRTTEPTGVKQQGRASRLGVGGMPFLLPLLWSLYQRLWLPALMILLFDFALLYCIKSHVFERHGAGFIDLGFHVIVGYLANDWLRRKLMRRGYILADITAGNSLLLAEQRYFERYLAAA